VDEVGEPKKRRTLNAQCSMAEKGVEGKQPLLLHVEGIRNPFMRRAVISFRCIILRFTDYGG